MDAFLLGGICGVFIDRMRWWFWFGAIKFTSIPLPLMLLGRRCPNEWSEFFISIPFEYSRSPCRVLSEWPVSESKRGRKSEFEKWIKTLGMRFDFISNSTFQSANFWPDFGSVIRNWGTDGRSVSLSVCPVRQGDWQSKNDEMGRPVAVGAICTRVTFAKCLMWVFISPVISVQ